MNKYAANGLAIEAMDGKDVIVIALNVRDAMQDFDQDSTWVDRVKRANGAEEISYLGGGKVRFLTEHHRSWEQYRADIIFIDWPVATRLRDEEFLERLHHIVAERNGVIVRA